MGEKNTDKFFKFLSQSIIGVSKYVIGKLLTSLIIGVCMFAVMYLLDAPLPWLWGLLGGLGNTVPTVGIWIAYLISAIVLLFLEPIQALYLLIVTLALQLIDDWVLTPFITGKSADLKPLVVIIAVMAGSSLFGIPGVLLAIPVAIVVKIFYNIFLRKNKEDTGNNTPPDEEQKKK
ncbi:MAG TPA: hypothetical protein DDZ89_19535 [Clostridiales bacterium]|nr:hypothetical protein [Clostridiales bacterium]